MDKLSEARLEINLVDEEMLKLFERRMKAVKMVAEHKLLTKMAVLDSKREAEIIEKNLNRLNDRSLAKYYRIMLEGVLLASRTYQEDYIRNEEEK